MCGRTAQRPTHEWTGEPAVDAALDDTGLARDQVLRQALHDYFAWATTTSMAAYPESPEDVPTGLRIPRWSWDGLQAE